MSLAKGREGGFTNTFRYTWAFAREDMESRSQSSYGIGENRGERKRERGESHSPCSLFVVKTMELRSMRLN